MGMSKEQQDLTNRILHLVERAVAAVELFAKTRAQAEVRMSDEANLGAAAERRLFGKEQP